MNKTNQDIWTSLHWWGWKIHLNQAGLDLLNDKLTTLRYWLRPSYCGNGFNSNWWYRIILIFIYFIITKIINFKFKECNMDKRRWCENIFECNELCKPIIIKEISISFWWLPLPLIPIKKEIVKY